MIALSNKELEDFEEKSFSINEEDFDYDPMRSSIFWNDEKPAWLTGSSYDYVIDLICDRMFLFHLKQLQQEITDPSVFDFLKRFAPYKDYKIRHWQEAQRLTPRWPGFKRTRLTPDQLSFHVAELLRHSVMEEY